MSAYYNEMDPHAAQWLRNLIKAGQIAAGDVDERSIVDVRPDDLRGYTQCHFFAGIAVWSHALRLAGWSDDRPVWTGSCPCQPFSSAGAGKGTDDPRHLWPVWFDLIRQCRPATVFGEQVEAAIKHGWLDLVQDDLENAGYACGAICLPAGAVGAPHQRQRLWFVANAQCQQSQCQEHTAVTASVGSQPTDDAGGRGCASVRLGHSAVQRCSGECIQQQPQRDHSETDWDGQAGHVADTNSQDSRRWGIQMPAESAGAGFGAPCQRSEGFCEADTIQRVQVHDFWADADWLYCRDEKWRPVEPGTFPLVDGAAFRMGSGCTDWEGKSRAGMLKAYGNAIVPQVAAAVIQTFMEYAP